ncbi:nucleotidyltransferase family protein [Paenibacillus pasadenensis]|uniref:nucleotidyltransferase family protein n=1 Tax=Paenibacillus pasadenensis TaxID=217090 RepID=UPI00203C4718|nr:nucleotidyltransferase family protein [Paenibacillus pasadenensis]MCM3746952.1 nucleotidyltransferase family protein [Paenibacillus pasadenensis]
MIINGESDILEFVRQDEWMMDILRTAQSLELPDWLVCAGFVRSKIWDVLHGFTARTPLGDIDVVYFDPSNLEEAVEKELETRRFQLRPDVPWSVKNQARMHLKNNFPPYTSTVDAISKFPETATALGLALDDRDQVILAAPCGLEAVLNMELSPTPYFLEAKERLDIFDLRMKQKNWQSRWPKVTVVR